jgi:glycosyltransferase involved in cell wall biosynthesis
VSRLRIAQVAPPLERVPPSAYGGTERIVFELVRELHRRGHEVTTFASGDSAVPGNHVVTSPRALRPAGIGDDPTPWTLATACAVIERAQRGEYDVIHSHLEQFNHLIAAGSPVPVIATFHGRIDHPALGEPFRTSMALLVAISAHQASTRPEARWTAVVHNGLNLDDAPADRPRGEGLVFVGRITPEKGVIDAIQVARRTGRPLTIAAKLGPYAAEQAYYRDVFLPALEAAGRDVEYVGELDQAERDELVASSYASLAPAAWPEPFGLSILESLACGTPVIARRVGGLPEIIREGVDGFFGDDVQHLASLVDRVAELDPVEIRRGALDRFNAERMTDRYETLMLDAAGSEWRTGAASSAARRRRGPGVATGRRLGPAPDRADLTTRQRKNDMSRAPTMANPATTRSRLSIDESGCAAVRTVGLAGIRVRGAFTVISRSVNRPDGAMHRSRRPVPRGSAKRPAVLHGHAAHAGRPALR